MATRMFIFLLTLSIFFQCLVPIAAADTETDFTQRLSWPGDNYALRYEVIIEEVPPQEAEAETGYTAYQRIITEDAFVEISLPPGNYRYGVIPYDLLNRPVHDPFWVNFVVLPALKPEIYNFSPPLFSIEENALYEIIISGKNLISGAEIILYSLDKAGTSIIPLNANFSGSGDAVSLIFASDDLVPGAYGILVKNPGGLEARAGEFTIIHNAEAQNEEKPIADLWEKEYIPLFNRIDAFFGAAWSPLIRSNGDENDLFNQTPLGAGIYMAATATGARPVNVGMELGASWHYFSNDSYEGSLLMFRANLLVQKRLAAQGAAFAFRVGGGYGILTGESFTGNPPVEKTVDDKCPTVNLGVSFIILESRRLFLEAGVNYSHLFSKDLPVGFVEPWFGFGLRY